MEHQASSSSKRPLSPQTVTNRSSDKRPRGEALISWDLHRLWPEDRLAEFPPTEDGKEFQPIRVESLPPARLIQGMLNFGIRMPPGI
jgi:hypothetical protein